jgi:filamentous hemagglutinin family protein
MKKKQRKVLPQSYLILLSSLCVNPLLLLSNPQVESFRGDVQVQQQGKEMVVHASDGAIVNYRNFDVHEGEAVWFKMKESSDRILNRIHSDRPSYIDGRVISNGIVYLLNPAGVVFGARSIVDVASLIVAAAHLGDDDFLAGRDRFQSIQGKVEVLGHLSAKHVKLIGNEVAQNGKVEAQLVIYSRDNHYYVGKQGEHLYIKCEKEALSNDHDAPFLAAGSPEAYFIHHGGTTKADTVAIDGAGADVLLSGTIDVSSGYTPRAGGTVVVHGRKIHQRNSEINAKGILGGGKVLLGGDEPRPTALEVDSDQFSAIRADALVKGDAGTIVLNGQSCKFNGFYSLLGGTEGGNGGTLETSGSRVQGVTTKYQMFAPNGESGTWKIDPHTIHIVDMGGSATLADLKEGAENFVINSFVINNAPEGSKIIFGANDSAGYLPGTCSISLGTADTSANINVAKRNVTLIFDTEETPTTRGQMVTNGSIHSDTIIFKTPVKLIGPTNITASSSATFNFDVVGDESLRLSSQGDVVFNGAVTLPSHSLHVNTDGDLHFHEMINTTGQSGGDVTLMAKTISLPGLLTGGAAAFPGSTLSGGRGGNVSITTTDGLKLGGSILATGGAGAGGGSQVLPTLIFPNQDLATAGADSPGNIDITGPIFLSSSHATLRGQHIHAEDITGCGVLTVDASTNGNVQLGALWNLRGLVVDNGKGVTVSGPVDLHTLSLFNCGSDGILFHEHVSADAITTLSNRFAVTFAKGYTAASTQFLHCQDVVSQPPEIELPTTNNIELPTLATPITNNEDFALAVGQVGDFSFDTSSSLFSPLRLVSSLVRFTEVANAFTLLPPTKFVAVQLSPILPSQAIVLEEMPVSLDLALPLEEEKAP